MSVHGADTNKQQHELGHNVHNVMRTVGHPKMSAGGIRVPFTQLRHICRSFL